MSSHKLRSLLTSYTAIFFASTFVSVVLLALPLPYSSLQGIAVILFIVSLLLFQYIGKHEVKNVQFAVRILLFSLTLLVELLTISTGGLTSHFLLLAALLAFGISFLLSITDSFIFLLFFSLLLAMQLVLDSSLRSLISEDLTVVVLFIITYIFVTILSYILNRYYHVKDVFLEVLQKQIRLREIREESILSGIEELIIITDKDLAIISVNNAVEKAVVLPKNELLGKPIFERILLRNGEGQLVNRDSLSLEKVLVEKTQVTIKNLALLSGHADASGSYALTIKPVRSLEGDVDQILFMIQSDNAALSREHHDELILDQIITKQAALIESVKRMLQQKGITDLAVKAEMIGKIDREIRQLLALERTEEEIMVTAVNSAVVGNSTCEAMHNFANALHVHLICLYTDVAQELQSGSNSQQRDEAEQRLRILYSVQTNLFWLEVLLHKLIEIAILLASTEEKKEVTLTYKRVNSQVLLSITVHTTKVTLENKDALFHLNFDTLQSTTNLSLASGLEGYIAKRIGERLQMPIAVHLQNQELIFTLLIKSSDQE